MKTDYTMTTHQFNQSVNAEIRRMMESKAVQVCSAGDWPEDHGGNFDPSRREANFAFSDWLDQQGDSLPEPTNFSEHLERTGDSL